MYSTRVRHLREVEQSVNQSKEISGYFCNHEPNYNSDASSMTSASLGLDVTSSSFSTQYEPLLAQITPMELCEQQQAELSPSSDQRDPESAFKVQNTSPGTFEIRQSAKPLLRCVPIARLMASDRRPFQNDFSVSSIEIAKKSAWSEPFNPFLTPKIPTEPSSTIDGRPTNVQLIQFNDRLNNPPRDTESAIARNSSATQLPRTR